jgi:membrane-bound metal-dependent hydrolase YbcI (DUF457 family)
MNTRDKNWKLVYLNYLRIEHGWAMVSITLFILGFVFLFCFETNWIRAIGATSIGAVLAILLADVFTRGEFKTNWYTVRRSENPILFRLEFLLATLLAVGFTILLFLNAFNFIGIQKGNNKPLDSKPSIGRFDLR